MIMQKTSSKFFRRLMKKSEVIDHAAMLILTRKIDEGRTKKKKKIEINRNIVESNVVET